MWDVSVVILNWNSEDFLLSCLASLERQSAAIKKEIIVIDNGSRHKPREICAGVRHCRLIENETNRGVAPARNQGIREAGGRYIMILDVDTVLADNALAALLRYMEERPHVGIAGPKLVFPDGDLQLSCRLFPTVISKISRRLPVAPRFLRDELLADWDHSTSRPVGYVIGACQLIRREVFQAAGLLDEKIFYGPEDVDFCLRAWKAGFEVHYVPGATVSHYEQRITKRLFTRITWLHICGLAYYFRKHRYLLRRPSFTSKEGVAI